MSNGIKIVHNKLLGGWYVVRGPHQTPLGGRHDSKAAAQAWLGLPVDIADNFKPHRPVEQWHDWTQPSTKKGYRHD